MSNDMRFRVQARRLHEGIGGIEMKMTGDLIHRLNAMGNGEHNVADKRPGTVLRDGSA